MVKKEKEENKVCGGRGGDVKRRCARGNKKTKRKHQIRKQLRGRRNWGSRDKEGRSGSQESFPKKQPYQTGSQAWGDMYLNTRTGLRGNILGPNRKSGTILWEQRRFQGGVLGISRPMPRDPVAKRKRKGKKVPGGKRLEENKKTALLGSK